MNQLIIDGLYKGMGLKAYQVWSPAIGYRLWGWDGSRSFAMTNFHRDEPDEGMPVRFMSNSLLDHRLELVP